MEPLGSFLTLSLGAPPISPPGVSALACILWGMKTPDITPTQIVAIVAAVLQVVAAFGFDLTTDQHEALLALCGVLSVAVLGDAHVRGKRADNADRLT